MHINVIDSIEELQALVPQWNDLVLHAHEENLNYEPVPLLSLLSKIAYPEWFVICAHKGDTLVGLFPMQKERPLPLGVTRFGNLFKNHFMSCVPLIHKEHVTDSITAFWDWLNSGHNAKVYCIPEMLPNSPIMNEFLLIGEQSSNDIVQTETTSRACGSFYEGEYDEYIKKQLSAKSRSSHRSKHRKLSDIGGWRTLFSSTLDDSFDNRLNDLVEVEASGWKSANGSAIAQHPNIKQYIFDLAEYAANQNRFLLANAYVQATPVASMYCIVNNRTLHIYKIGFDENYKQYSVGQLLLLDLIQYVMSAPNIDRIDSCAVADSEMYNRCLPDQQTVLTFQTASNHIASKVLLSGVTHTRSLRNRLNIAKAS